jgi:hypothetical protein
LGHSDIKTTAKYVIPDMNDQHSAMSTLSAGKLLAIDNTAYKKFKDEASRRGGRKPKGQQE